MLTGRQSLWLDSALGVQRNTREPKMPNTEKPDRTCICLPQDGFCYRENCGCDCHNEPSAPKPDSKPPIPEAIDALMWDSKPSSYNAMPDATHNRQILEAWLIGKSRIDALTQSRDDLLAIIEWLDGRGDEDFPERKPGQGAYWWRGEMMRRLEALREKEGKDAL